MVDALEKFLQSTKKLLEHIDGIEQRVAALDSAYLLPCVSRSLKNDIDAIRSKQTDDKIFNYSVTIVSLYGYFETFVESLMREYVWNLNKIGFQFSSMPNKFKKSLFKKVIRLSEKMSWEKFKHIDEKTISTSLFESFNQDKLNLLPEAYFTNAGNYKMSVLSTCLGELGIDQVASMVFKYPDMSRQLSKEYGAGVNFNTIEYNKLYSRIDEVVDRRNIIAHGAKVEELLDISMLKEYISFFIAFSKSLNQFVNDSFLEMVWNSLPCVEMSPYKFFPRVNVACFRGYDIELKRSQKYICKTPHGTYPLYIEDRIVSMEQNHKELPLFLLDRADSIGIAIKNCHDGNVNYKFKFM